MAERFSNEAATTLAAGINAAATSLPVSSSANFPAANFRVRIDNEILLVTAVAGTTWTVTRAVEAVNGVQVAASHAVLATVAHVLTAGGLQQALQDTPRKNRLINGDFRVNQRALSTITDNAYGIDRWRGLAEGGTHTWVQSNLYGPSSGSSPFACIFQQGATGNKLGAFQVIESFNCWDLRGQVVSLQFKPFNNTGAMSDIRASILYRTGTADAVSADPITTWGASSAGITTYNGWTVAGTTGPINPGSTWPLIKLENISIPASATNIAVIIWADDNAWSADITGVTDVQLEKGAVCTEFERIPLSQSYVDCLRYAYVASSEYIGNAKSGTTLYSEILYLPMPMRVTPTISGATYAASTGANGTPTFQLTGPRTTRPINLGTAWTVDAQITLSATFSAEL
jgi:hypothetical protein